MELCNPPLNPEDAMRTHPLLRFEEIRAFLGHTILADLPDSMPPEPLEAAALYLGALAKASADFRAENPEEQIGPTLPTVTVERCRVVVEHTTCTGGTSLRVELLLGSSTLTVTRHHGAALPVDDPRLSLADRVCVNPASPEWAAAGFTAAEQWLWQSHTVSTPEAACLFIEQSFMPALARKAWKPYLSIGAGVSSGDISADELAELEDL